MDPRPGEDCTPAAESRNGLSHRNNPHALEFSGFHAAWFHLLLRQCGQAEILARALDLSEKNHFPNDAALCRCNLGYALAQVGRIAEGIAQIRQGIADLQRVRAWLGIGTYTRDLAEALAAQGNLAEALDTVESALQEDSNKPVCRPEELGVRGELRLKTGQPDLAEADFRDSIAYSRSMSARSLELRTTMSLARLLAQQGRRDEARVMLAYIYNWFTEGFDTADLTEAKLLLEELGGTGARPTLFQS